MTLTPSHQKEVARLLKDLNLPNLYKHYDWNGDTWEKGFPYLFRLEQDISKAARQYSLGKEHLMEIARWGGLPNPKRIDCPEPIKITLYTNDAPAEWLEREPENAVWILEGQTRGFGPTYCSKVLHFAVPSIFGAIDTRLVRTFGQGDPGARPYKLLDLAVTRKGKRWEIKSRQAGWPREYGTWTTILNHIAKTLNEKGEECPHPPQYLQSGLRKKGVWLPADVETALFTFASQEIQENTTV